MHVALVFSQEKLKSDRWKEGVDFSQFPIIDDDHLGFIIFYF